jgi:hypothetical protein
MSCLKITVNQSECFKSSLFIRVISFCKPEWYLPKPAVQLEHVCNLTALNDKLRLGIMTEFKYLLYCVSVIVKLLLCQVNATYL